MNWQIWVIKRKDTALIFCLAMMMSFSVLADGSGVIEPFPQTGAYQATLRHDVGSLSVIEFAGNYDRSISGNPNVEPRAVVAKAFLNDHADQYDFLVVFSTFKYNSDNAIALHWGVQNKVQGLGLPQYDVSELFGSAGQLQGYIDMGHLGQYVFDPLDPRFENVLSTLGHEVMHQWSGRARFDQGNGLDSSLIGREGSHWSNLLDSDASVLYGHEWRDLGNGRFTSTATLKFFSALDLYLAGLRSASEVPPMSLLLNPEIDTTLTPEQSLLSYGPTIEATSRTITIDDIIAAEGPRVPAASSAHQVFRFAFIILTGQGEVVGQETLGQLNIARRAFMDRFSIWTGGRATAQVYPEGTPIFEVANPDEVIGSDPRLNPASLQEGFAWLRQQQSLEGFWQDKDATLLRDTAVSLDVLARLDSAFVRQSDGVSWLSSQASHNSDYLARQAMVLARLGQVSEAESLRTRLLAMRNADGGWGIDANYHSTSLDTALVLGALLSSTSVAQSVLNAAADYLIAQQNNDGGWGGVKNGPSRTSVTATVLSVLKRMNRHSAVASSGMVWLAAKQNPDGGFGDSPSTSHDTATVLKAMIDLDVIDQIRAADASDYLRAQQDAQGSWQGSTYTTAVSLDALRQFSFPNWSLLNMTASATQLNDGDRIQLAITLRNDSNLATPVGALRLFDGEPTAGGSPIGVDINVPVMVPGAVITFKPSWDSFNLSGAHRLVAVIDPDDALVEMSEQDNRRSVDVIVNAAPAGVDLSVINDDVLVIPNNPNTLPANLGFAVMVRNLGSSAAEDVSVQLRLGAEVLDEQILTIAGRATVAVNFFHQLVQAGSARFSIVLDAANAIAEASELNNHAEVLIETQNSLDLFIGNISSDTTTPLIGHDISFSVDLNNQGTNDSPSSTVRYLISDGSSTTEIQSNAVQIEAGQRVQQTVVWRVDREADFTFSAVMDPNNLIPELDETNNTGSVNFTSGQASGPNLVVDFSSFTFDPEPALEGSALTLNALVRNTGADAASNIEVAFYNGDPNEGGVLIGRDTIVELLSNAATNATVVWSRVPDSLDKLLFVVVDPANAIVEFSEDDNRAFNTLKVQSLIDLSISSADISLSPGFPRAGDELTVSARISNLGQQPANGVVVRVFDGDPNNAGQPIGLDQTFDIGANAVFIHQFSFMLPNENVPGSIVIQVDPDNVFAEQNESNNEAKREFAIQDGNFYVSERYISPNGDGVQDNTQFFFRLMQAQAVDVFILNESDERVRRFSGASLDNTSGADVTWNGLDELGRVVSDGRYRFQVSAHNIRLGEAVVHVDTNRSPLTQSLGTTFASFKNLTCPIGNHDFFSMSSDDSTIHFAIPFASSGETYPPGIYRMQGNGSDIKAIVPQSFFAQAQSNLPSREAPLVVSDDGSQLAFFTSISGTNPAQYKTWFVEGDGGNLNEHPRIISTQALGFSHDNSALLLIDDDKIFAEPVNGSENRLVADITLHLNASNLDYAEHWFSPNHKNLLLGIKDFNNDRSSLLFIDLVVGEVLTIASGDGINDWNVAWSNNGLKFVLLDQTDSKVKLFGGDGSLISSQALPSVDDKPENRAEDSKSATMVGPAWSSNADEFAFIYYFDDRKIYERPTLNVNNGGVYVANIAAGSVDQVYQFKVAGAVCVEICDVAFDGPAPMALDFLWAPHERTLLLNSSAYALKEGLAAEFDPFERNNYTRVDALWSLSLEAGQTPEKILTDFAQVPGDFFFSNTGRQLLFRSLQENQATDSVCVNSNDQWSFKSLFNLVAELQAIRSQRVGGVLLSGTAADVHFDYYQLDYASVSSPRNWIPVQAAANEVVIDDVFTTWIPPKPGSYFVRLTVRDLAGNVRQAIKRVAWSDTPSITDLSRSNSVISPNGDGALDDTTIQYRILEPVHLEFNIYNSNGELLRTIVRDHSAVGSTFEFVWDGRNGNGVLLPDGEYTLVVQDYEFFITLDSTLPVVNLTLNNAYQSLNSDGHLFVDVRPSIEWSVSDVHYLDSVVQTAPLNDPSNSAIDLFDLDPRELGEGVVNRRGLGLHDLPGQIFSLIAEDRAGNRVVRTVGPASEELIIAKFGQHVIRPEVQAAINLLPPGSNPADFIQVKNAVQLAGGFFVDITRAPYAELNSVDGPNSVIIAAQNEVSFLVSETINKSLTQMSVQYRVLSESQWLDAPLDTFYTDDLAQTSVLETFIPERLTSLGPALNDQFKAVWLPENLNSEAVYAVRMRSVDQNNNEHFSNVIRIQFSGGVAFRGLVNNATGDEQLNIIAPLLRGRSAESGEFILWGQEFIAEPIISARLRISSDDDPRYMIEQEVGVVYAPDGGFIFRSKDLSSCQQYRGYVSVVTASGTQTSSPLAFSTACVDLRVSSEPVSVASCNLPSREQVVIKFAPSSIDGRDLALLTFASAEDANNVLFNVNNPKSVAINHIPGLQEYAYETVLDVSAYAEGRHNFVAYLENIDGQSATLSVPVLVDRTPPALAITYPSETGLVCGVQRVLSPGVVNNVLTLEGSIQDANGLHYTLELANGPAFEGEAERIHDSRRYNSFRAASNQEPEVIPVKTDFHLGSFNGALGEIFNRNGEYTVRLSVFDQGGFQQCANRTFVFDGQMDVGSVAANVDLFSPNGDGQLDQVSFTYTLEENAALDIEIYAATLNQTDGSLQISSAILSRVLTQQDLLVGSGSSSWDGLDDSGVVLADGLYAALLRFTDACGNQATRLLPLTIDNTAPQISVGYPSSNDPLQMMVEVVGSVRDPHFASYSVDMGVGSSPQTWLRLDGGVVPVVDGVLARWNTFSLVGDHYLRVSAQDQVGNRSEQLIALNLQSRVNLIRYLEAIESHFSPNNDNRRESSSLRIGLDEDSLLSVNIFDVNNSLRRQLVSNESFSKGPVVINWDGRGEDNGILPDGVYTLSVSAVLASNNAVQQTEIITVTLDATRPVIDIQRPNNGFVNAKGSIAGSITDDFLTSFSVAISNTPAAPVWQTLSEGNYSVIDSALGRLSDLAEGQYALRVIAIDKGDSRVERVIPFVVDNTKPQLNLLSPIANSVLGGQSARVNIVADVNEANPARYELHYGLGLQPSSFMEIVSGTVFPIGNPLHAWDISPLEDGVYTLRLTVTDAAGLTASSQIVLTIDHTQPIAAITSPANNGYVTQASDIVGSASDDNLLRYSLAISPGSIGAAQQFSEIGLGSGSVDRSVLLNWQVLPSDGIYTLRLLVEDYANNVNEVSTSIIVDTHAPAVPIGLTAKLNSGQTVDINWQANNDNDLAGYYLYRAGVRINSEPIKVLSFTDSGSSEGRVRYSLSAVDHAGLESPRSSSVEVLIDNTAPATSIALPINNSTVSGIVDITGSAFSQDDFKEYRVYIALASEPTNASLIRQSPVPIQGDLLTQWNTIGLVEGERYNIRLEAEDINGNIEQDSVSIIIDNAAPAAPIGLSANVNGDHVALSWGANLESDLLGYLVYRNDRLANAHETVIDELSVFAIKVTQYNDLSLADGDYDYSIVAIDMAGNTSSPSNIVNVSLDTHNPQAMIVRPQDQTEFDMPLYLLGRSVDQDIASVQFQYRREAEIIWNDLGAADTAVPFEANFNPVSLSLGLGRYQLRAVATDHSNKVDASPALISVIYTDLTHPASVVALAARVSGGEVALTWAAGDEPDLAGYHINRVDELGNTTRITNSPVVTTAYRDAGLEDGVYRYSVVAVDNNGNESQASNTVDAMVYTPVLQPIMNPTLMSLLTIQGAGPVVATVIAEVTRASGTVSLPQIDTDLMGAFSLVDIPLENGENTVSITLFDQEGNTSKVLQTTLVRASIPSQPTGLNGSAADTEVTLSWNQNPETNIIGYRLMRNGENVLSNNVIAGTTAVASNQSASRPVSAVLDGSHLSYWDTISPVEGQWLSVAWSQAQLVSSIKVHWFAETTVAKDFNVEALFQGQWVRLLELRAFESSGVEDTIRLPHAYRTTQIRLQAASDHYFRVAEFKVNAVALINANTYSGNEPDGEHDYRVSAFNDYGFESVPSDIFQLPVGDTTAPDAVVLSADVFVSDVTLSWNVSTSIDIARYDVYRDNELISMITDLSTLSYRDNNRPNGNYQYNVHAVDNVANESLSNSVDVTVLVVPPNAPIGLSIESVDVGAALNLSWDLDVGQTPIGFRVFRSNISGGPYEVVADTNETQFTDTGLDNNVTYYYVIASIDGAGNLSAFSNEVSAIPQDNVAPAIPILYSPTTAGNGYLSSEPLVNIAGSSEPGTTVSLLYSGFSIAGATASNELKIDTVQNEYVQFQGRLSPRGNLYAYADFPSNQAELHLYDFATDTTQRLTTVPHDYDLFPSWSAAGTEIVFTSQDSNTSNFMIQRYSLKDGSIENITNPQVSDIMVGVLSPNGRQLAAIGYVENGASSAEGVWLFDLHSEQWTLLREGNIYDFYEASLQWSPNGRLLSYVNVSLDPRLEVVDINSGNVQLIDAQHSANYYTVPRWSVDSDELLYVSSRSGNRQVWRYSFTLGLASAVTNGPDEYEMPQWSPDNKSISVINLNNDALLVLNLDTQAETVLASAYAHMNDPIEWLSTGLLMATIDSAVTRYTPAGRFEFNTVPLLIGDNHFSARAEDDAGNLSGVSAAIMINYNLDDMADLTIRAEDVRILPVIPRLNTTARISITVSNIGQRQAAQSKLSLMAIDPNGQAVLLLDHIALNPIASNASQTVSTDWPIGADIGRYRLIAVVDADNQVLESSESNNAIIRDVFISDSVLPAISLSSDAQHYIAQQDANFVIGITNRGNLFNGRLQILIEDKEGYLVQSLSNESIINFNYSEILSRAAQWNTGNTFSGRYQITARLYDEQGDLLVSESSEFNIGETSSVDSSVISDRSRYPNNSTARVSGTVHYLSGNNILSNMSVRLRILDPSGDVISEHLQALNDLMPGASDSVSFDWSTGVYAAGEYPIDMTVYDGVDVISESSYSLAIVSSDAQQVGGALRIDNAEIGIGEMAHVSYLLSNTGSITINQLPVLVSIIAPDNLTVVASVSDHVDLGLNAQVSGNVSIPTTDLRLKPYTVILQADIRDASGDIQRITLDSNRLTVSDQALPLVTLKSPSDGQFINGSALSRVRVVDAHSLIARVEASIDGGVWRLLSVQDPSAQLYGEVLPGLGEGLHSYQVRATDSAGNIRVSEQITFEVDNQRPTVIIEGINDGDLTDQTVVPIITINDINLVSTQVLLNGYSYTSGTPITDTDLYSLYAHAEDRAGNVSERIVIFGIDKSAPVILVYGIEDGDIVSEDVTIEVIISDFNLVSQSITLNGQMLESGTTITLDGEYELLVSATDFFNNNTTTTVNFTLDKTAPTLMISNPVNGAQITAAKIDIIGESEAFATITLQRDEMNSVSVFADNNGVFEFNNIALLDGLNEFTFTAHDQAGNLSETITLSVTRITGSQIELEAQLLANRNVLIWLSNHNSDMEELLNNTLTDQGIEHKVVYNQADFIKQLRTRHYATVLLADDRKHNAHHGHDHKGRGQKQYYCDYPNLLHHHSLHLSHKVQSELRPMVAAGLGFVFIKTHAHHESLMNDVFGAKVNGRLIGVNQVELDDTPMTSSGLFAIDGDSLRLSATTGTAIGKLLPAQRPALIANQYVDGKTILMGFSPIDLEDQSMASALVKSVLDYVRPAHASTMANAINHIRWTASGFNSPLTTVRFDQSLMQGMAFISVAEDAVIDDELNAHWNRDVINEASAFDAHIKLPGSVGEHLISVNLFQDNGGQFSLLASAQLSIDALLTQEQMEQKLLLDIGSLTLSSYEKFKQKFALKYVEWAIQANKDNKQSTAWAIAQLRYAYWWVNLIKEPQNNIMKQIGQLLFVYQKIWTERLDIDISPEFTFIQPIQNEDVSRKVVIKWRDKDPDSDATISLYYDTDNSGADGILIAADIDEDDESDHYHWKIDHSIQDGQYYIYAVISDDSSVRTVYAPGAIIVSKSDRRDHYRKRMK